MPSYNGLDLGPVTNFLQAENPVDWQQATYAGVNGLQMNWLGGRGSTVAVSGYLTAATMGDLAGVKNQFLLYQRDGVFGVLDMGNEGTLVNGILMEFRPAGPIELAPGFGFAQAYTMRFLFPLGI